MENIISAWEYDHGIVTLDSGFTRPRMAGAWILEQGDAVAVVETGTPFTTPLILQTLAARGWRPEHVRWVIVTHVHLDHAGGAGSLMAQLPEAEFLVHSRGARHMIDPTKLESSARRVYGDELFDRTYGHLTPIPEPRVRVMADEEVLDFNGRRLQFFDTPGHAKHHFCIWDETSRGWFSGDTFGLSYRELDTENGPFIFPTTTPIHFDPDAMHASLDLLMSLQPQHMYLTHFGRISGLQPLADKLHRDVDRLVEFTRSAAGEEQPQQALQQLIRDYLFNQAREHGCLLEDQQLSRILEPDIQLNTQGLLFWLQRYSGQ